MDKHFDAVKEASFRALRTINAAVTADNTHFLPVPYAWNNGTLARPTDKSVGASLSISLGAGTTSAGMGSLSKTDSVWLKRKDADKFIASGHQLHYVLVYFMTDGVVAYAPMRPLETYQVSVYDGLGIRADEFRHVLSLEEDKEYPFTYMVKREDGTYDRSGSDYARKPKPTALKSLPQKTRKGKTR